MAKQKRKTSTDVELNEIESSYQAYVKKKYKSNKTSKRIALAFIISATAIVFIVCAALLIYNNWLQSTKINNVSIGGISLEGLTVEEAEALLNGHKDDLLPKDDIIVKILEKTFALTIADSKAQLDIAAIADSAYIHGRDGKDGDIHLELDPRDFVRVDSAGIRAWLKANIQDYNGIPVETTIEVTGERPDLTKPPVAGEPNQILQIKLGTPKHYCAPEPLFDRLLNAYRNRTFEIIAEVILVDPEIVTAEGIFNKTCVKPVNATLDPETFVITEGIYGYGFDIKSLQAQLDQAQWGDVITLTLEKIKPSITSDSINAELFADVLATYTAVYTSQAGRDVNLRLACQAINGIVLYPGDSFSYNKTLGKRTAARGYKLATSYIDGEVVKTYGGGICQVSSALYWCTMHADLEILERINHTRMVTYIPKGMDASVSWGATDYRFRNNSKYPVKIEAKANKGTVTVTLRGTDYKDYYIKVISKTVKTMESKEIQKEYPVDNKYGYVNGQVIYTGRDGYVFETYRCKYDKATNKEITEARVLEAVSNHKKTDTIIAYIPEQEVTEPASTTP